MFDSQSQDLALLGVHEAALFANSGQIHLPASCACSTDGASDPKPLQPTPPVLQPSSKSVPSLSCGPASPLKEVIAVDEFSTYFDNTHLSSVTKSPPSLKSSSTSCGDPSRLIEVVCQEELPKLSSKGSDETLAAPTGPRGHRRSNPPPLIKVPMDYNEYGELVPVSSLSRHPTADELNVTQLLRVIKKRFHHEIRSRFNKILTLHPDTKSVMNDGIATRALTSWDIRPGSPTMSGGFTPEEIEKVTNYEGPTRVLEIGCSDGSWCFSFKKDQPTWIVEGVDDTDHWCCVDKDLVVRSVSQKGQGTPDPSSSMASRCFNLTASSDFMLPEGSLNPENDYFGRVAHDQTTPEFTVRDLNSLLYHQNPMCHNLYSFVRAREVFDRVENYKTFCDGIRLILKRDGIVEFIEVDPRPRFLASEFKRDRNKVVEHKSEPADDWTDNIPDRLKGPSDEGLTTHLPGWQGRVEARLKATLRPRDGIPAVNLKSWMEGAGFCDVKEIIQPIPVGGGSKSGQLLKDLLVYQAELEDSIPKLRGELPQMEMMAIESGAYCLNLHIVTCRKSAIPRPGDLLKDGTRQDMTRSKLDAMGHYNGKDAKWKRFDLEGQLSSMMKNLTSMSGGKEPRLDAGGDAHEGGRGMSLFTRVAGKAGREGPFMAPPFVTVQQMDEKKARSGAGSGEDSQNNKSG